MESARRTARSVDMLDSCIAVSVSNILTAVVSYTHAGILCLRLAERRSDEVASSIG